ncbi:MAG: Na/Pi cotransporter family protein [Planctomycetes bacterium]|nr:Na/Pi cotransporter family protein [Planctomycetota bacterium]
MDAANLQTLLFNLIGGLGLFLLGMKYMSEGMQAIAGASLRRMIAAVTNNRFLAVGVGTAVTATVQSSSVTTVMVVGFVNSGVMQLSQAIGVIMGANIGTTITGVMLMLKVGKFGLPLLGVMAIVYRFAKGDRWRYWGMFFMGVGMVFFGLELMKTGCAVIDKMPDFKQLFRKFQADSYLGVLECAMIGCSVTLIVQSSSATLAITISLATQGQISYETAAALVLGENIGTTITAIIASLGATTNARRAAYFHVIFNVLGVIWVTSIFPWYIEFIKWLIPANDVTARIAATHTIFNVANMLLFLPFVPFFTKFLERIVPSKPFKEKPHLTDLDIRMLETPILAIEQSRTEILKMADGCEKMLDWLAELLRQDEHDTALADRLRHRENVLDSVQDEVTVFVTSLLAGNIPHSTAEEGRRQIRMADEYESVSDYIDSILNFDRKLRKNDLRFAENQLDGLLELHGLVAEYLRSVNQANREQNDAAFVKLEGLSRQVRQTAKRLRKAHLEDLSTATIAPQVSVAFMAALNSYSRVRDHAQNIGEVITGEK